MRILYMGTPDIAETVLSALYNSDHEICAVFTREDKPIGRKQILTMPPVKKIAIEHNTPVYQPKTLKNDEIIQIIKNLLPDIIVVVAYGRILPPEVLCIPKFGCVNVHVSKLPKYRGAAPIQWAVINGDKETGITVMQMDEGLDTGDVLITKPVEISENETSGELFEKIASLSGEVLLNCISLMENGDITPVPQNPELVSFAPPLSKEMAEIKFDQESITLHNLVRGMNPWPVAWFIHKNKKIKVTVSSHIDVDHGCTPGTILSVSPLVISCQKGALELKTVVPEGKKAMDGSSWVNGMHLSIGDTL